MILEGLCDWSNDAKKIALKITIHYILKYINIEKLF